MERGKYGASRRPAFERFVWQPLSISREFAALRRAFRLAVEQDRLTVVPTIKLFREENARQGFVSPADFEAIVASLPHYLKDMARFAFLSGWRKGELRSLAWSDVNRDDGPSHCAPNTVRTESPALCPSWATWRPSLTADGPHVRLRHVTAW